MKSMISYLGMQRNIGFAFFIFLSFLCEAQQNFLYQSITDEQDAILDCQAFNSEYYTIRGALNINNTSEIVVLDANGIPARNYQISEFGFLPMRILEITGDDIILLGKFRSDTCSSVVSTVNYNFNSQMTTTLSSVPFCENNIQNLRLTGALDGEYFVTGYWVSSNWNTFIIKMGHDYMLEKLLDSLGHDEVSIDFSRNGYLLRNTIVCNFYDRNFNYLKQKYKIYHGINSSHQTYLPFDDHLLLENFGGSIEYEDYGQHVRLVDSNLNVKKHIVFPPLDGITLGEMVPPFFGGISISEDGGFWVAGNYNMTTNPDINTSFSISKVSSSFEIECTTYYGYDGHYRLYGIQQLGTEGAIAFGSTYLPFNDPFILKVGSGCEQPITSIPSETEPFTAITVYPNPTYNSITFDVEGFDPSQLDVEIINTTGLVVFFKSDLSYEIHVNNLPPGQYFYRIRKDSVILGTGAWIKQ